MLKKHLSLEDMELFAKELKAVVKAPAVLLLEGPLGVGKTTLVRFLLQEICAQKKNSYNMVSSPAFVIQNSYSTAQGLIQHVDLYRLKDDEDLESTGFWDLFSEPKKNYLIIVEWANRLSMAAFPSYWNCIKVKLFFSKEARYVEVS